MITNKNTIFALFLLALAIIPATSGQAEEKKSYFAASKEKAAAKNSPDAKPLDPSLNADLVYRVAFGRAQDVQMLLDKGADPEAKNTAGMSVLLIAIIRKDAEAPKIVDALLKAGANVNKVAADGNMAVIEAVKSGRPDVLQILIDNRAVLGIVRDNENNDLQTMAETRGNLDIVKILNSGTENEKDKIQLLKSEDNFIKLVQQYAYLNCANEYLNFYISTETKKVNMVAFDKVVTENTSDIQSTGMKLKTYFRMKNVELQEIQVSTRSEIINALKFYETNENRELNGVGTDEDLNRRCNKISEKWNASRLNMDQLRQNTQ